MTLGGAAQKKWLDSWPGAKGANVGCRATSSQSDDDRGRTRDEIGSHGADGERAGALGAARRGRRPRLPPARRTVPLRASRPLLANARFGRGRGGRAARDAAARLARTATVRRPKLASLTAIYRHALTTGFSRGFLVTAGMMLLALIITIAAIRVKRADLGEARL